MELEVLADVVLSANFSTEHRWLAGNVDGDEGGRDDLVLLYDHDGDTSVGVYRSTGSSFEKAGTTRTGAFFSLAHRWRAGDFDGDGMDDLILVYGYDDGQSVTARLMTFTSRGAQFEQTDYQNPGAFFSTTQRWETGDFDGDGLDDLLLVYAHSGRATLMAFSSTGSGFVQETFDRPGAAFSASQQWLVADADDDGLDDVVLVYDHAGEATAMRFSSTGEGFEQTSFDRLGVDFRSDGIWLAGHFATGGAEDVAQVYPH
jgi:hypothetical protein